MYNLDLLILLKIMLLNIKYNQLKKNFIILTSLFLSLVINVSTFILEIFDKTSKFINLVI